jgi:hypothetical protein
MFASTFIALESLSEICTELDGLSIDAIRCCISAFFRGTGKQKTPADHAGVFCF